MTTRGPATATHVGRTVCWNPPVAWRAGKASREEAAARIAKRYREFVDLFEER